MIAPRFIVFLALALLAGAAAAAEDKAAPTARSPAAPPLLSSRFKQVRERIDALFQLRNRVPLPLDPATNPFRPAIAMPASPQDSVAMAEPQLVGDMALLQQAIATLKITGGVERSGESLIAINGRLYRKGDLVQSIAQGQSVDLRVRDITGRTVTLSLNKAETVLKF